jgi:hypothetical protein
MHAASAFALSDAFVSMLSKVAQSNSKRLAASVSLVEALAHSLGSIASTRGFVGLKQAISSVCGGSHRGDAKWQARPRVLNFKLCLRMSAPADDAQGRRDRCDSKVASGLRH